MRCKKHVSDFSSSVGVCASCLRLRLEAKQQLAQPSQPPPLIFPSTPQANPSFQKKKSGGKFGLISKLFRSKSSVVSSSSNSVVEPGELTRCSNRGMSPQNEWNELEERERESTTTTRPSPGRVKASPARLMANNVASFAFCLSPLVRASPASRYHWGAESGFSGEIRVPVTGKSNGGSCNSKSDGNINDKPHLSEAASFCANRSRKLADFGRLNRKR
uniref:Uncharacterized protein n=1 Tax=Chenopodium quinoa TaxID=63459 RepID=A0A803M4I4_CHEQI